MAEKDKDVSQKSAQGNRGAAGALAEEPWLLFKMKVVTWCPIPTWAPQLLSPFLPEPCTSPVWGPGVSLKSKGPSASSCARPA